MRIDARGNSSDANDNIIHLAPGRAFNGIFGHDGKPLDASATPDLVGALVQCLAVMGKIRPIPLPPLEMRNSEELAWGRALKWGREALAKARLESL